MILSRKQIEEIAAAITKDFHEFFFGAGFDDSKRFAQSTPIDQFARDYLGLSVSFARLSSDGSICGLTAYADTEYEIVDMGVKRVIPLKQNQVLLDESFIQKGQVEKLCGKRQIYTCPRVRSSDPLFSMNPMKVKPLAGGCTLLVQPFLSGI